MSSLADKLNRGQSTQKVLTEIKGLIWAIFVVLLIRSFIIQPFMIPSGSMIPTLLVGDFIFVTKYNYGWDNVSLPFSPPVFPHRVFASMPKQGDIVVFRGPAHVLQADAYDKDFIKRLIGVPGDRIQMIDGILHINGKPCPIEEKGPYFYTSDNGKLHQTTLYEETLPNGVKHVILKETPFGHARWDNTREFIVPDNHFFFMGDNRDGSWDSRDENFLYMIPFDNIIGQAQFIWFSTAGTWSPIWKAPEMLTEVRWDRIGTRLK